MSPQHQDKQTRKKKVSRGITRWSKCSKSIIGLYDIIIADRKLSQLWEIFSQSGPEINRHRWSKAANILLASTERWCMNNWRETLWIPDSIALMSVKVYSEILWLDQRIRRKAAMTSSIKWTSTNIAPFCSILSTQSTFYYKSHSPNYAHTYSAFIYT